MVTGSVRRAAAPAAGAAGLAVLVWASVSGPARMIGPLPPGHLRTVTPPPRHVPPAGRPSLHHPPPFPRVPPGPHHLSWVGDLLGWTVLLVIALAVVALLVWLWRNRWHRPPARESVPVDVLPLDDVAEALERTAAERLAAVEQGSPRNGIVACWVLLEESIAEAGLPRRPWETSTEYTVRVLHRLDLDPRSIGVLAGLYREARFSEHAMGEDARAAARAALTRLGNDLRHVDALAASGP